MKNIMSKRSANSRLLSALAQSTAALIQTYGMGMSMADVNVFMTQENLHGPDRSWNVNRVDRVNGEANGAEDG